MFASVANSAPWWMPIALTVLGGLLSFLGSYLAVRQSLWRGRRDALDAERREMYPRVCEAALDTINAAKQFRQAYTPGHPDKHATELEAYFRAKALLDALDHRCQTFSSAHFSSIYEQIRQALFSFYHATDKADEIQLSNELDSLYDQLRKIPREDLGIDSLDIE